MASNVVVYLALLMTPFMTHSVWCHNRPEQLMKMLYTVFAFKNANIAAAQTFYH